MLFNNMLLARWNSTFYLLERIVELRRAIGLYEVEFGLDSKLSAAQWETLEKVICLVRPFEEFTKQVSSETASVSTVIPYYELLKELLESTLDNGVGSFRMKLLKGLKKHFSKYLESDVHIAATLLDPRFKARFLRK